MTPKGSFPDNLQKPSSAGFGLQWGGEYGACSSTQKDQKKRNRKVGVFPISELYPLASLQTRVERLTVQAQSKGGVATF